MKAKPIYSRNGIRVGMLRAGVYSSYRSEVHHVFNSIGDNGSWGIDYKILHEQLPEECTIQIIAKESGRVYRITKKEFIEKGQILHFKQDTADHNVQVFLPLEQWKVKEKAKPKNKFARYEIHDPYAPEGKRVVQITADTATKKRLLRAHPYARFIEEMEKPISTP